MNIRYAAYRIAFPATLLLATNAFAQTGFAGTITFAMHSRDGTSETMVQTIKGTKLRIGGMSGSAGGGDIIFDGDARTMTLVMNEQKMYMQMSQDDGKNVADRIKDMIPPGAGKQKPAQPTQAERATVSDARIVNTGRTETVAGTSCEVYRVTSTSNGKPEEGEVCMAKGVGFMPFQMLGALGGAMGRGAPTAPDMSAYNDLMKDNRGIVKMTSLDGGKPFVELEATKIDRSVPGDDMFLPPPGFTKFQMPQFPAKRPPGL